MLPSLRDYSENVPPICTHASTALVKSKLWVTECEMALLKWSICIHQTNSEVNKVVILHLYMRNEAYAYVIQFDYSNLLHLCFSQQIKQKSLG